MGMIFNVVSMEEGKFIYVVECSKVVFFKGLKGFGWKGYNMCR